MLAFLLHATVRCASVVVIAIAAAGAATATAVVLRVAALDLRKYAAAAVRVADVKRTSVVVIANHRRASAFASAAHIAAGARAAVVARGCHAGRRKDALASRGIAGIAGTNVAVVATQSHAADASSAFARITVGTSIVVRTSHAIGRRFHTFTAQALIFCARVGVVAFGVARTLVAATDNDRRGALTRFHIATVLRARFAVVAVRRACAAAIAILASVDRCAGVVVIARHIVGARNGIALASRRVAGIFGARIAVITSRQPARTQAILAGIGARAGVVVVARVAVHRLVLAFALLAAILCARVVVVALSRAAAARATTTLAIIATIGNRCGDAQAGRRVASVGSARVIVIANHGIANARTGFAHVRIGTRRFVITPAAVGCEDACAFSGDGIARVAGAGVAVFTNSCRTGNAFALDAGVADRT